MPELAYLPTTADVARRLRTRAVDEFGAFAGDFSATTDPTAAEVLGHIRDAAGYVSSRIGITVPDALLDAARSVVALRAAMLVELGGKPEQANDASGYRELRALFTEELGALLEAGKDNARPRYGTIAVRTPTSPLPGA